MDEPRPTEFYRYDRESRLLSPCGDAAEPPVGEHRPSVKDRKYDYRIEENGEAVLVSIADGRGRPVRAREPAPSIETIYTYDLETGRLLSTTDERRRIASPSTTRPSRRSASIAPPAKSRTSISDRRERRRRPGVDHRRPRPSGSHGNRHRRSKRPAASTFTTPRASSSTRRRVPATDRSRRSRSKSPRVDFPCDGTDPFRHLDSGLPFQSLARQPVQARLFPPKAGSVAGFARARGDPINDESRRPPPRRVRGVDHQELDRHIRAFAHRFVRSGVTVEDCAKKYGSHIRARSASLADRRRLRGTASPGFGSSSATSPKDLAHDELRHGAEPIEAAGAGSLSRGRTGGSLRTYLRASNS